MRFLVKLLFRKDENFPREMAVALMAEAIYHIEWYVFPIPPSNTAPSLTILFCGLGTIAWSTILSK